MEICEQMGGVDGPLLLDPAAQPRVIPRAKENGRQKAISS